jgi:hypothetical protein
MEVKATKIKIFIGDFIPIIGIYKNLDLLHLSESHQVTLFLYLSELLNQNQWTQGKLHILF